MMINLKKEHITPQNEMDEIYPKAENPVIEIHPTNRQLAEQIESNETNSSSIVPTVNYPFFQVTATSKLSVLPLPQHAIPGKFIRNVKKCYRFLHETSKYMYMLTFFKFIGSFDQLQSFLTDNYPKLHFVPRTTVLEYPRYADTSNSKDLAFLNTQNRFLVAVDHKEYIYIDALSSYCRLVDEFYEFYENN